MVDLKKVSVKNLRIGQFYVRSTKEGSAFLSLYLGYYRQVSYKIYVFYDMAGLMITTDGKEPKIADIQPLNLQEQVNFVFQHPCDSSFIKSFKNGLFGSILAFENNYNSKGFEQWYIKSRIMDNGLPDVIVSNDAIDTNLVTTPVKKTLYATKPYRLVYYFGYSSEQKVHKFMRCEYRNGNYRGRIYSPNVYYFVFETKKKFPKLYPLQAMLDTGLFTMQDIDYLRDNEAINEALKQIAIKEDISVDD